MVKIWEGRRWSFGYSKEGCIMIHSGQIERKILGLKFEPKHAIYFIHFNISYTEGIYCVGFI